MSDPILFVAADPRELSDWVNRWENVSPVALAVNWARAGKWKGRAVAAIANGAGAERAFAAAILAGNISAVCNTGFCGALDKRLNIGDVVVGTEVRNGTHTYPASLPGGPKSSSGPVMSIDHVAQTAEEKRSLRETGAATSMPIIVEMEAAGVARAAEDLGVPFYCVRAVSDLADETFANDFNAALTADGRFSVVRLVAGGLSSPQKRFGELLRLQRRTAVASKKLGEFLADCTF
jgi:adenosylhomocysteine nucleosidase